LLFLSNTMHSWRKGFCSSLPLILIPVQLWVGKERVWPGHLWLVLIPWLSNRKGPLYFWPPATSFWKDMKQTVGQRRERSFLHLFLWDSIKLLAQISLQ
jgi:hypothetical protein